MTELTDCLLTHKPRVMDFPGGLAHPSDLVPWALEMFEDCLLEADMQSSEANSKVTFFDQKDPTSFERFKQRIQNAQPVHGGLALIDYCTGDGTVRDKADWAWEVYEKQFARAMEEYHPMGTYLRSTLWMSRGNHLYEAHCDLTDGFLFHMSGRKRVRVWPVPKKYRQRAIFNHRDFKGRMASEPIDFELQPRQVLFIPSGAMHEVIDRGEEAAVSVSFHMGSPVPMLTLCAQLNRMVQGGKVSVPPYMKKIDKFNLFFFEPTHFMEKTADPNDGMPDRLLKELSGVLQSKQVDLITMRRMLSNWWRLAMSRPMYQGPYPERVK